MSFNGGNPILGSVSRVGLTHPPHFDIRGIKARSMSGVGLLEAS